MKALSIQQPWADSIVHRTENPKRVENRTWRPPAQQIGTRFLIHASLAGDRAAVLAGVLPGPDARGAILAVATLASYHQDDGKCCALWGQRSGAKPVFHWQLSDVVALSEPVPATGALRFWTPAPAVLDAVQQQIEAVAR